MFVLRGVGRVPRSCTNAMLANVAPLGAHDAHPLDLHRPMTAYGAVQCCCGTHDPCTQRQQRVQRIHMPISSEDTSVTARAMQPWRPMLMNGRDRDSDTTHTVC